MRFQDDFGQFLALALAIHRRDEVATAQFIRQLANQVTFEFEENESMEFRSALSRERYDDRLAKKMAEFMKQLDGLIDPAGRKWLQSQLKD